MIAAGLIVFALFVLEAASRGVVNRARRDHQNGDDRKQGEQSGQPEHRGYSEHPAQEAGQGRANHVAGMVECLIDAILPIEPGLLNNTERHAVDGGTDCSPGDSRRYLGDRNNPKVLR